MAVTIVTDSTCDIYPEVLEQKAIKVVPLRVQVGAKSYIDRVNLSTEELYAILREGKELPTTSQPSVQDFVDLFGQTPGEILFIHISSALSGTGNVAQQAKQLMGAEGERIHVYDSHSLTLSMGLQVLLAKEQADLGKSSEEIIAFLKEMRPQIRLYFSLSDLTYVHRGGRIGKAAMTIGNLLRVKPIFTYDGKTLVQQDKAFGNVQVINKLVSLVQHDHLLHPISRIFVAHGGCEEYLPTLESKVRATIEGNYDLLRGAIGSVIAVHAGPGALGVMYY